MSKVRCPLLDERLQAFPEVVFGEALVEAVALCAQALRQPGLRAPDVFPLCVVGRGMQAR
jgi:hypothetical protein